MSQSSPAEPLVGRAGITGQLPASRVWLNGSVLAGLLEVFPTTYTGKRNGFLDGMQLMRSEKVECIDPALITNRKPCLDTIC